MPANTKIHIKEGTKAINDWALSGCSGLTSIIIPESVKRIGNYAFKGCYGLTSITIPNSVKSIGAYAFDECYCLKEIHFCHEHPENIEIGEYPFSALIYCTLYVPIGAEHAYRNHEQFKGFEDIRTFEISFEDILRLGI